MQVYKTLVTNVNLPKQMTAQKAGQKQNGFELRRPIVDEDTFRRGVAPTVVRVNVPKNPKDRSPNYYPPSCCHGLPPNLSSNSFKHTSAHGPGSSLYALIGASETQTLSQTSSRRLSAGPGKFTEVWGDAVNS